MSPQQIKDQKLAQLRKVVRGQAHLVRLNAAGMDYASHLLDANPSLTIPQILEQVDNLASIPADRI